MRVVPLAEIESLLPRLDLVPLMEEGFVAHARGEAVIPPVGELLFDHPPGDVHIKYGYLRRGAHYVIKIASGFYDNPRRGLPSSDGLMLLFERETGRPAALLLDEGRLTDARTAAAGAVAAKHLAPPEVRRIGILGTGTQARLQLAHLAPVIACRRALVWGRREPAASAYAGEMRREGYEVEVAARPEEVASRCELLVTTTPATEPLFDGAAVRPGTHVTAVGSDTAHKQELDPRLLARADVVVADSLEQCRNRGEIFRAVAAGELAPDAAVELGAVIAEPSLGRTSAEQITVADLTGVAVQDLQIASAVLAALEAKQ